MAQMIETGTAGLVGSLWTGARGMAAAAAREARELAEALELDAVRHRAGSLLDRGIEVPATRTQLEQLECMQWYGILLRGACWSAASGCPAHAPAALSEE